MLDYSGGPSVITSVLKSGGGERRVESKENVTLEEICVMICGMNSHLLLLASKMEEDTPSQGM